MAAVEAGYIGIVQFLLDRNVDVNMKSYVSDLSKSIV
jgi:hypothetical protein